MSVTKRQGSRNSFGSTLPVLLPLYDSVCEAWQFFADEEIVCGAGEECQFRLDHESIADRHCAFTLRAGTLTIRRIDGRIWLNEIPVSSEAILACGDIVSIGPVTIQIDETTRPVATASGRGNTSTAPASVKHQEPVTNAAVVIPQQFFQPAHNHAPAPFLHATSNPIAPPPLPAVFFEDHSAKITAAAELLVKERIADVESRERLVQAREQQLQELELLIRDRERICLDRQSTLDERVQVLGEQKTYLEEQRAQAEAIREQLHQQKLDLERRLRQQAEREDELASQLESSATGYAQLEQTRGELSARLNDIQQREAQLDQQRRELEELAAWVNTQKTELQVSTTAAEYRAAELHSKEAALNDAAADLAERQQSVVAGENLLREREAALSMAEQRVAEAGLQIAAADTKLLEAERRMAEAEAVNAAAAEMSGDAEQRIQEAILRLQEVEQTRSEMDRQRNELETLQQEAETKHRQITHLEEELVTRAADLDEQSSRLASALQELESQRRALNLQQELITEQSSALEQRISLLDQREADLSSRGAHAADETSTSTRSVEQLMSIAVERESAIRTRQEAALAVEELKATKAALADAELALNARSLEIESRSQELAERVAKLKVERDAVRAREEQLNESSTHSLVDTTAIVGEHQRLMELQAALTERETRAQERENAANVVVRNAEAERDALQRSHKDLICERNALMQFSQDLNSRANGLAERENIVSQQTEELKSRFHAMTLQSSELQRLENELNLRGAELHRRITQFKSEIREQKRHPESGVTGDQAAADVVQSGSDSGIDAKQLQELTDALQSAEAQLRDVQAERDALLMAVRELQKAMLDAREDVEEANRLRTDAARQEQTLVTLYQTVEERSGQLQLLESRLRQAEAQSESLEKQLDAYRSGGTVPAEVESGTAINLGDGRPEPSEVEADLMRQLEALKAELKPSSDSSTHSDAIVSDSQEQNRLIEELRRQNEALEARISELTSGSRVSDSPVDLIEVDELQAQLSQAREIISDRDDLIRELRMRLSQQMEQAVNSAPSEKIHDAELQKEARELDRRASLLDAREEEVRERLRKVSNAEEEVEAQRRQLLDARQQLELARTEIQVAMKQHAAAASFAVASEAESKDAQRDISFDEGPRPGAAIFGMEAEPVRSVLDESDESNETTASAALDLRAELASLFGLGGRNTEMSAPELISDKEMPDTSEPLGASKPVALSFGEDASRIVAGRVEESASDSSADSSTEDSSDDFVRDYMEQLLSRSRKSAGNSLPSELSGGSKGKSSGTNASSANSAPKGPPKVKSFIDEYMAGGGATPDVDFAENSGVVKSQVAGNDDQEAPLIPRVKVDVEKLRQNMDSFRSVATQSVEKALVTHALRTERLSINGRIFLVGVMGFMTMFLGIANYKGIISQPALIWITIIGTIGAGMELTRKMYAVKSRGKALVRCEEAFSGKAAGTPNLERLEDKSSTPAAETVASVPPPIPDTQLALSAADSFAPATPTTSPSPYTAIAAVAAMNESSPIPVGAVPLQKHADPEKDEYFEL